MKPNWSAGRRGWLRDRRIRTKLAMILILPIGAVVVLAGVSVTSAGAGALRAEQSRRLVALSRVAGEVVAQLQRERAAAALVFTAGGGAVELDRFRQQVRVTQSVVDRYRAQRSRLAGPAEFRPLLGRIDGELAGLVLLRERVQSAMDVVTSAVVFRYRAVVADLLTLRLTVGQAGMAPVTAGQLRAAATLSQAAESLGLAQTAVVRVLAAGQLSPAGQEEIVAATTARASALEAFGELAPARWRARLTTVVSGAGVVQAERLLDAVSRAQPGELTSLGVDPGGWVAAVGAEMTLLHRVESQLDGEVLGSVAGQRDALRRTIATVGGLVAVGLLVMVGAGIVVSRSLTRSLSALRAGTEDVATVRLPEVVARLDAERVDPAAVDGWVAQAAGAIVVAGRDEVGQVAAAFNAVAERAVRVAVDQAALRAEVRRIYMALARRLQRRVERLLGQLDRVQRDEADPARLERLFEVDHAATLMRRMIADLQVLAGGRAGQPRPAAVALVDVLRAAQGEIEQYQRVDFAGVDREVHVDGDVAEECIHLLAGLLDNATRFSAPTSMAVVAARMVGDQLHVQVVDQGTGMTEAQVAAVHDRLARPTVLDHAAARQMGLPVVAAIAARLGIRVEVRSIAGAGTRVNLTVPATVLAPAADDRSSEPAADPALVDGPPLPGDTGAATAPTMALPALSPDRPAPPPAGPVPPAVAEASVSGVRPQGWPLPGVVPTPPVVPVIYHELTHDWYGDDPAATATPTAPATSTATAGPRLAPAWRQAAEAAEVLQAPPAAEVESMTVGGLPVRRPGRYTVPATPQPRTAAAGVLPSEELRRRMAAFQRGLAASHTPHPTRAVAVSSTPGGVRS